MSLFVVMLGVISALSALTSLMTRSPTRRRGPPSSEDETPSVTLFVPCCDAEEGLEANLKALSSQDYPGLRICYVVESRDDGAVPVIERQKRQKQQGGEVIVIVSGAAEGRGQKVHNLLAAVDSVEPTEVWVFADSDGRPDREWLRRLVAALAQPDVDVASTYRFYVPEPRSFATLLRSVWNASVLSLLGEHDRNFAWGGGTAIRRDVFDRAGVRDAWSGALSDDYALTHAVRRSGGKVTFVPDCLVPSYGSVSIRELLSWVTRQIKITRVYWPALFWAGAVHHGVYTAFLVLGPWAGGQRSACGWQCCSWERGPAPPARAVSLGQKIRMGLRDDVSLASLLTFHAVLRALVSRRIEWRGRIYEMRSPTETVIVRQSR